MSLGFVFFDVGETLVDESRAWRGWADYVGVPAADFFSALDEVIAAGVHHEQVFRRFRPGFDLAAAVRERKTRGDKVAFGVEDLYPDAAPCLRELRAAGVRVGIAGNRHPGSEIAAALPADVITSGEDCGADKPSAAFFASLIHLADIPAGRIAYVGDRVDNDIVPARAAGMVPILIPRGPWGKTHASYPSASLAAVRVASLAELPSRLRAAGLLSPTPTS